MSHPALPSVPPEYLDARTEFVVIPLEREEQLHRAAEAISGLVHMLESMGDTSHDPAPITIKPLQLAALLGMALEKITPATRNLPIQRFLQIRQDLMNQKG